MGILEKKMKTSMYGLVAVRLTIFDDRDMLKCWAQLHYRGACSATCKDSFLVETRHGCISRCICLVCFLYIQVQVAVLMGASPNSFSASLSWS